MGGICPPARLQRVLAGRRSLFEQAVRSSPVPLRSFTRSLNQDIEAVMSALTHLLNNELHQQETDVRTCWNGADEMAIPGDGTLRDRR